MHQYLIPLLRDGLTTIIFTLAGLQVGSALLPDVSKRAIALGSGTVGLSLTAVQQVSRLRQQLRQKFEAAYASELNELYNEIEDLKLQVVRLQLRQDYESAPELFAEEDQDVVVQRGDRPTVL